MSTEAQAAQWGAYLEAQEKERSGPDARNVIARRARVAPGFLENLKRGRIKRIAVDTYEAIRRETIRELEREILALSHELDIARASAVRPDEDPIFEAQASIEAAREALKRLAG